MLAGESDHDVDATIVLTKTILQVIVLHYRDDPKDGKVAQALDALATAAALTIAGDARGKHGARVYFNQRLGAAIEQIAQDRQP